MPFQRLTMPIPALVLALGCSSSSFDAANETRKLLQRDAEWALAASEGTDVDKIVSYWSEDAVVIPQGQSVAEGKAAIRAFVTNSLSIPGFKIRWVSETVSFSPDGKLAYMRGTNEMTVPGPTGVLTTLPGRGISVWRLEPDGESRCVVDIWNDPPAPAAARQ